VIKIELLRYSTYRTGRRFVVVRATLIPLKQKSQVVNRTCVASFAIALDVSAVFRGISQGFWRSFLTSASDGFSTSCTFSFLKVYLNHFLMNLVCIECACLELRICCLKREPNGLRLSVPVPSWKPQQTSGCVRSCYLCSFSCQVSDSTLVCQNSWVLDSKFDV
jgi:hypothetical protein